MTADHDESCCMVGATVPRPDCPGYEALARDESSPPVAVVDLVVLGKALKPDER